MDINKNSSELTELRDSLLGLFQHSEIIPAIIYDFVECIEMNEYREYNNIKDYLENPNFLRLIFFRTHHQMQHVLTQNQMTTLFRTAVDLIIGIKMRSYQYVEDEGLPSAKRLRY